MPSALTNCACKRRLSSSSSSCALPLLFAADSPTAAPGSLFYKPKTAPFYFGPLINACQNGDLEKVKSLWRPYLLRLCNELGRDETCHPLLVASHHLKVDVVDFLLQQGLNPRQRGTVHPYAGDLLTVSELQGE